MNGVRAVFFLASFVNITAANYPRDALLVGLGGIFLKPDEDVGCKNSGRPNRTVEVAPMYQETCVEKLHAAKDILNVANNTTCNGQTKTNV
jgi:hypothetical protein